MDKVGDWIEHLDKPLVLLGFIFIAFVGVIKLFKPKKLSNRATERLINLALRLIFIVGVLIIGFTLVDRLLKAETSSQMVKGGTGTVMQAGNDINHNQGNGTSSTHNKHQVPAPKVDQYVEDSQGDVYQGGGNVNVQQKQ